MLWTRFLILLINQTNRYFLTFSRKFINTYIVHITYPENSTWKLILLQTKIFNICSRSIKQWCILKFLSANCIRETTSSYLPQNCLRIKRLLVNLACSNNNDFITLDCRGINPNCRGRFRSRAENLEEQTWYFNIGNKDKKQFNTFLSKSLLK